MASPFQAFREAPTEEEAKLIRFGSHAEVLFKKGLFLTAVSQGTKGWLYKNWESRGHDLASVRALAKEFPKRGIGIQGHDHFITIDVDADDEVAAETILRVLREAFQKTGQIVIRIGRFPRFAIFANCKHPIAYFKLSLQAPDGKIHEIENLGKGRHAIAFNRHEDTGEEYYYPETSLLDIEHADDLITVTDRDELEGVLRKAVDEIGGGWSIKTSANDEKHVSRGSDELTMQDVPSQFTDEQVIGFMADIKPSKERDYDRFIKVGMALHHHFDGSNEGYEVWVKWSAQSPQHDERLMPKWWTGFSKGYTGPPITAATLKMHANDALKSRKLAQTAAGNPESLRIQQRLKLLIDGAVSFEDLRTVIVPTVRDEIVSVGDTLAEDDRESLAQAAKLKANGKIENGGFGGKTSIKDWRAKLIPPISASSNETYQKLADRLFNQYVYQESNECYIDLYTGTVISRRTLNHRLSAVMPRTQTGLSFNAAEVLAGGHFWFREMRRIVGTYYEVEGEPLRLTDAGWEANLYKPGTFPTVDRPFDANNPEDVEIADMINRHLRLISDDDAATAKALLQNLAHLRQHPNTRIYWAFALMSETQGNGKNVFENLCKAVLGNAQVGTIAPRDLNDLGNTYVSRPELLTFLQEPEAVPARSRNRFNAADLKDAITADIVSVRRMRQDPVRERVHTQFGVLSNFEGVLGNEIAGRRWLPVIIRARSENETVEILGNSSKEFFDRYDRALNEPGSRAAAYLETIDLDGFDRRRVPDTRHKVMHIDESPRETLRKLIRQYIAEDKHHDIGPDVLNWRSVRQRIANETSFLPEHTDEHCLLALTKMAPRRLLSVFRDAATLEGFVQLSHEDRNVKLPFVVSDTVKANTVWYRRELIEWDDNRRPHLNDSALLALLRQTLETRKQAGLERFKDATPEESLLISSLH